MSPFTTRPRRVAILGLGPSIKDYLGEMSRKKSLPHFDEIWGVNTTNRAFKLDKIWVMDDLADVSSRYPEWAAELRTTTTPIITPHHYEDFPTSWPFPKDEVCSSLKDDYFTTTPAYMVGYAIHIGVEELYLFGIDYYYPNAVVVESGASCVAYWLGVAKQRGIHYKIPASSSILDANMIRIVKDEKTGMERAERLMYGYDFNPQNSKRRLDMGMGSAQDVVIADRAYRAVDENDQTKLEVK